MNITTNPGLSPTMREIDRQLDQLRKQMSEMEEQHRRRVLVDALNEESFPFGPARRDVIELLLPQISIGKDRQVIGPEGISVADFVKNEVAARAHWPQPNGGAPASSSAPPASSANGIAAGPKGFEIEKIQRGMSESDRKDAWASIVRAVNDK